MCTQYVSNTRYYGCGDTVIEKGAISPCPDKGKPGHQTSEHFAGSGRNEGKCGQPNCRQP
ncbi:hypothetical protein TUN199_01293 [Pyrenophora tritici-repentis]|uniref:Uncharacterized protein n=1 Tax=Pyrenophora tritici-repentis TaxID=45151 RepID=A0A5M9KQP5_9PLEO|nr:hypothetical protein PtrV1_13837 [Pyrenophora tritici-repentis]KAF7569475.1 hypothetical protein PtrM4_118900 [Pyrenophora tritici-repentis]KAI0586775.1 hypothetical protein Alg215_01813 [Pyrenophora tritici-repentis]KAI0626739.1 hypothetical protein TUN199_01293 [Pyrenophora tritici-repentis]